MTKCPGSNRPARVINRADDGLYTAQCSVCAWPFVTAMDAPVIARHYLDPDLPNWLVFA